MQTILAHQFRTALNDISLSLHALPPELADTPWRPGGWTRKQILGHLMDSAANNRQRFVLAATDGHFAGPNYKQEPWVNAHGYVSQTWATLLRWWVTEHEILAAVVDNIPEDRLAANCVMDDDAPVTLRFLIEDYIEHQRGHLVQMSIGVTSAR